MFSSGSVRASLCTISQKVMNGFSMKFSGRTERGPGRNRLDFGECEPNPTCTEFEKVLPNSTYRWTRSIASSGASVAYRHILVLERVQGQTIVP